MRKTFIRLNAMPSDGKMPKGVTPSDLIGLSSPADSIVIDVLKTADLVDWKHEPRTHYFVLESDSSSVVDQ